MFPVWLFPVWLRLSGLALVSIVLSACSDGRVGPQADPAVQLNLPTMPTTISIDQLVPFNPDHIILPLDNYRQQPKNWATIENMRRSAVERCMHEEGHHSWKAPAFPVPPHPNQRRYGVSSRFTAERWGYTPPPNFFAPPLLGADTPISTRTVTQTCLERILERLPAQPDSDVILRSISRSSIELAQRDRRVILATKSWSACMASRGFHYKDPYDAIADPRWHIDDGETSTAEIETAVTDVSCSGSSGLTEMWWRVESAIQLRLIRANRSMVNQAGSENRQMVNDSIDAIRALL